ncbi:MAG: hypothetical protein GX587_08950 [Bacteroidales bacterium]|nr:hypothetical protein [Bacteroidales bacterium]
MRRIINSGDSLILFKLVPAIAKGYRTYKFISLKNNKTRTISSAQFVMTHFENAARRPF